MSSIRVMNGKLSTDSKLYFMQVGKSSGVEEIGIRKPDSTPVETLSAGEVGYLIAGIKDVGDARAGETITELQAKAETPLEGYREPKPMVFSGLYPIDGDEYPSLRDALEKLRLNDSSFTTSLKLLERSVWISLWFPRFIAHGNCAERLEREFVSV